MTIAAGKQIPDASLERHGLQIVHLDDAIVVIDKPAGLLSMGSEREKEKTAHRILNEHLKALTKSPRQQVFIVHRLDRETSGLMVFARAQRSRAPFSGIGRTSPNDTSRSWRERPRMRAERCATIWSRANRSRCIASSKGGELAITHYRVLETCRERSLLELTLETGRKNQIRVQLAGDRASDCRRSQIWRDNRSRAAARAPFVRAEISPSGVGRLDGVSTALCRAG